MSPSEPVAVDADVAPCRCVANHVPASQRNHYHHIVPLSWGGPDTTANKVVLCPTGHDVVHVLLDRWSRAGQPGHYGNDYLEGIALKGWEGRPAGG